MSRSRLHVRRLVGVGLVAVAAAAVVAVAATGAGSAVRPATSSPARTVAGAKAQAVLVRKLALARLATAKYVTNLNRAKEDGYGIITQMIPNMGWHYLNPNVKGFDVRKPPILVYERHGSTWQLGAIEWVFTSKPAKPPLPGATYGAFGAGCHYKDGTFVPADSQSACPTTNPQSGAAFNFWHPNLVTLHVWLWYPNPSGLYASTNPLVAPFNHS